MKIILLTFLTLLIGLNLVSAIEIKIQKEESVTSENKERVFVFNAPIKNLLEFRELAKQASRLRPFGQVEISISNLAEKGFYEIPAGRNSWYEYASYNPTPYKFFPDPKIAPFIPADFVKKNRDLLLAKAKILREYGLGAAFWSYEPNFLPRQFFDKYPQMLGPRVDHPRRSNFPAFAPCIDEKETQEMFSNMVAELIKNVPEIHTFFFKTNDAGSGVCWSDWQYSGPNGPMNCKDRSKGERIETLMNSFKKGAAKEGKDISIYLTGSLFTDKEKADIYEHLPKGCYYQSHNSDGVKGINSMIVANYPVRGLLNPIETIENINSVTSDSANTIFISFRASYDRGYERLDATDKFIGLLVDHLKNPVNNVTMQQQLDQICRQWAGENGADQLSKAFQELEEANKYKNNALNGASGGEWGVSARQITRPLVVAPQMLSMEEEEYFMPFVFNASETEGRMDYTDILGAHRTITTGAMTKYVFRINEVITLMKKASENAPEKIFLQNMVKSLKIQSSIFRSIGNFAEAQAIRDRNAEKLKAAPHRPNKTPTWDGDPDLLAFNALMRDELDNSLELITVLEDGGMDFISHAVDSKFEDIFLLGPDLIDQLKLKRKIMLKHWTDIESYMTIPFK